jgi:hypothetical protein
LRRNGAIVELILDKSSAKADMTERTSGQEDEEASLLEAVARERVVKT